MKRKKNNIIICKIKAMHVYLYYKKKEQENITSDKKKLVLRILMIISQK